MSSKKKKQYVCEICGISSSKWFGKCFECNSFGSIVEETIDIGDVSSNISGKILQVDKISDILTLSHQAQENGNFRLQTSINEINKILGGGFVPGSIILIGGEPGIGKSTLLLQLAIDLAIDLGKTDLGKENFSSLYVSGEESTSQVMLRAARLGLGLNSSNVNVVSTNSLEDILATAASLIKSKNSASNSSSSMKFMIIDSVQTISSSEISGGAGGVSQIRFISQKLINFAKQNNIILILVGHITKEGQLAGPKLLEHMVDVVLYFENDEIHNQNLRILRVVKNRFGNTNEIGVFQMLNEGLQEVENPAALFISERKESVVGTSIFASAQGSKIFLLEIQSLITQSNMPMPRRSVVGYDAGRLSMILAVLNVRCRLNLMNYEIYLNVAGGFKVMEPAADLSVVAAIFSCALGIALPKNSIFLGEVSLAGQVRPINQHEARVKEAKRLGFDFIVCPINDKVKNDNTHQIENLNQLKTLIQTNDSFNRKK